MAMAKKSAEYYRLKKRASRARLKTQEVLKLRQRIAFAILCERGMDPRLAFDQIYSVQNCPTDSLRAPGAAE
jgi:hypothetical protein